MLFNSERISLLSIKENDKYRIVVTTNCLLSVVTLEVLVWSSGLFKEEVRFEFCWGCHI